MPIIKIQTGLRLEEQTYGKLKALAEEEGRSLNNLVEQILRKYLLAYEKEHGPITPAAAPEP